MEFRSFAEHGETVAMIEVYEFVSKHTSGMQRYVLKNSILCIVENYTTEKTYQILKAEFVYPNL